MKTDGAPEIDDPRAELSALVEAVRAHVEWQEATGASGLPVGEPRAGETEEPHVEETLQRARTADAVASRAARPIPPAERSPKAREEVQPVMAGPKPEPGPPATGPAPQAEGGSHTGDGATAGSDDRVVRLALVAERARSCTRCVLHETRQQAVLSRGSPYAELCFVGEGPGADEDAQGEPFVGAAGKLLDRMISAMGYARDEVFICNIVKCRPPNNRKPEPAEMTACAPFLAEQLALVRPRVLVALGATAVQGLIGTTEGITRIRGKWKLYKGTTPMMPTFHPAYLLRNPPAKRDVWEDLREVMRHLGKPVPK